MKRRKDNLKAILDLSLAKAEQMFLNMGQPKYRASQLFSWIFDRHVVEWNDMSNLALKLREQLASDWAILTSQVDKVQKSKDGTTKLLIRLFDGEAVESVCIP